MGLDFMVETDEVIAIEMGIDTKSTRLAAGPSAAL